MTNRIKLPGNCLTTAMGIMPHTDLDAALKISLSVDIPYWPQLPRMSYYEDMYVQSSERFPGIRIDEENQRITLDTAGFYDELETYFLGSTEPDFFELTPKYSVAFDAFLSHDLSSFPAIRGQSVGPISYGFKIADENKKPIHYNDEIREFMYDFMAEKANAQYRQLKAKNENALVWMDEPGLQMLFQSFTGYTSNAAARDYQGYLEKLEGPRGVHLCGNPDWSFLLKEVDLDVLSMDSYTAGHVFTRYTQEVIDYLKKGGIIAWGITPTLTEEMALETEESLFKRLQDMFSYLTAHGITLEEILDRSWFAPSRCCLVNPDKTKSVEKSFDMLKSIAHKVLAI